MDDARAVMDAVGSERAIVMGVSEGGPMATLFAATYPERTIALVLFGTSACWRPTVDYPFPIPTDEQHERYLEKMERILDSLMRFDYPTALVALKRKQDVARSLIEKTRGEVAVASRSQELADKLDAVRDKL